MSDKLFDTLPADQLYEELDYENLNEVMTKCKESDPKENNAILFDDMGAYLKDNEILKLLKELIMNRRHLHVSCFFLSQTYKSVPKEIRKLFSNIFLFRVSKHELEDVFSELIEQRKDDVLAISKLVFDKPFQYLFINTDTQRLFKGFDGPHVDWHRAVNDFLVKGLCEVYGRLPKGCLVGVFGMPPKDSPVSHRLVDDLRPLPLLIDRRDG